MIYSKVLSINNYLFLFSDFIELNNRTWVIDGISSEGIRITFILFQVFAILNGFFMIFFGYRYFRIVIYQTGFISGLLATFCILASRIQLGINLVLFFLILILIYSRGLASLCTLTFWSSYIWFINASFQKNRFAFRS